MSKRTRNPRILAAIRALDAHGKERGRDIREGHDVEEITDLLTDLMLCCRRYKVDFNRCLRLARMHFSEEKAGTP